jgi:ribosomal protein S18 acetylase RimI-like enzyme
MESVSLPENAVAVRVARAEDEAALAHLDAVAWSPASGFPSVMARSRDPFYTFFTDDNPPQMHLVAELGGRLAGYLRLKPVTPLAENAHVLGVMGLAVAPEARRRGVGAALLIAAERHARAQGARKLFLRVLGSNESALRLYRRLGFEREGVLRDEFFIDGRYTDDVLMAKHLSGPAA